MTRITQILWPADKVARFWRAVHTGSVAEVVYRDHMDPRFRTFGEQFSAAILEEDYEAACALLAPWIRETMPPARLRQLIDDRVGEMHDEWGVEDELHPTEVDLDGNSAIKVADLGDEGDEIPRELTDGNFRYWMCMQFMPAEGSLEFDAYFDLWAALVDHGGELRVGYFRLCDPD